MYTLIQQEVHLQTSSKNTYMGCDVKRKSKILVRQSSPLDTISIEENLKTVQDIVSEISTIINTSHDDLEVSGITPNINEIESNKIVSVNKCNKDDNKENSFIFKIPELPKRRSSLESTHCIEPSIPDTKYHNSQVQDIHPRRSLRLSIKRLSIDNTSNKSRNGAIRTATEHRKSRRYTKSTDIGYNLLNCHMNYNTKVTEIIESNGDDIRSPQYKRRSARISLQTLKNVNNEENSLSQKAKPKNKNLRNKCVHKLRLKKPQRYDACDSFIVDASDESVNADDVIDTSQEDIFDENTIKTFPVFTKTRSMRLSVKRALTSTTTSQRSEDSLLKSIV